MNPERFRQVEELFQAAREDRAALEKADPELRREVESLLVQDPARQGMLDLLAAGLPDDSTVTTLSAGAQLGPYKIEARIGGGGMGEVYRAIDTRLGRAVAIKTMQQKFSDRFEREARTISSLNHPNICTLYDVGPNYLVMELVEGETLAARLTRGKLSIENTLLYGGQIAAALAEAHSKGITHRDLKPGNIMVTKSGVKVLDFGLAKTQRDESLTASHAIMGTPAYMAPEQLEGKDCDARTDIYALGLVLREMATGKRDGTMEGLPPQLAHVLGRCLATDPEDRWHSAKDVQLELEEVPAIPPATRSPAPRARLRWIATVSVLALAFGVAIWGWLRSPPAERLPVSRWTMTLPGAGPLGYLGLSISRDGTRLAYSMGSGSSIRIYIRPLDEPEAKAIPGTEGGFNPFFSPDGQWLAYFKLGIAGALMKVPVTGGSPITLCDADLFGGSWGEDDRIIFSRSGELMRVSASGGACETLTTPDQQKGEVHRYPRSLPGGRSILFTIGARALAERGRTAVSFDRARIAVLDLKSRVIRVLINGGSSARYVPSGHLVYVRDGAMFAVPFDLKRLAVSGSEIPVIDKIYNNPTGGSADYSFSDAGLLVYNPGVQGTLRTLAWLDRKGTPQASSVPPQDYQSLRISPDGQSAALAVRQVGFGFSVWIFDLVRGALARLTAPGGSSNPNPVWTPDGRRVVFTAGVTAELYSAPRDGGGKSEPLLSGSTGGLIPDSWTPDGRVLLFESTAPARVWFSQPAASGGSGEPRLLWEESSFNESDAQVSPDGHWVAYTSDQSGKKHVYVRPFLGLGRNMPISIEGGQEPRWRRDGRELFYRDPEKNQLMAVDIQTVLTFRAGQPHALFALGNVPWDVAADGKRFLVVKEPETTTGEAKMQAVVNWFEELRQKAPISK